MFQVANQVFNGRMSECSQPESTNESADLSGDSSENTESEQWSYDKQKARDNQQAKTILKTDRSSLFQCSSCNYSSKYQSVLKKHVRKHHLKQLRSSMRTTRGRSNSNKSNSSLNNNSLTNGVKKMFVCTICEKISSYDLSEIKCHVYNDHLQPKDNKTSEKIENENKGGEFNDESDGEILHSEKNRKRKLSEINYAEKLSNPYKKFRSAAEESFDFEDEPENEKIVMNFSRSSTLNKSRQDKMEEKNNGFRLMRTSNNERTTGDILKCTECSFTSSNFASLDEHSKSVHKIAIPELKSLKTEPKSHCSSNETSKNVLSAKRFSDDENGSEYEETSENLNETEEEWTTSGKSNNRWRAKNSLNLYRKRTENVISKKAILKCPDCPFVARTVLLLNKHKELHKKIPGYSKCKYCSYNVKVKYALYVHEQLHVENRTGRREIAEKEEDFAEKEAYTKEFANRLRAKAKIITKMPQTEKQICTDCLFETLDSDIFNDHIKRHNTTGVDYLKCSNCSYSATTRNDLVKHKKLHDNNEDFRMLLICEKCPYATKKKENLEKHSTLHGASNFKFGCQYCSYFAVNFRFLVEHIKLHSKSAKHLVFTHSLEALKNASKLSMKLPTNDVEICDDIPLYEHSIVYCAPSNSSAQTCTKCPHLSSSNEEYLNHLQGHDSSKSFSFRCCDCDFGTKDRKTFVKHVLCHSICDTDLMYEKLVRHEKPSQLSKAYFMGKAAMTLRENHTMDDWRKALSN
ncbi:DgyrCDS7663 [Dimorphilus gyrociliatus]|uniref:DgyrCDS7663 n=1 Tax=Dimorphilus gyrociliatus TaxID=2664684 RepID=A0A7I8VRQ6_9ANNE|nr:DgyrCDS7663 [Dimorphilus gyrociliatus]